MRKLIFFKTVSLFSYSFLALASEDQDVEVCPGSGESCKVSKNGISNPFNNSKGKDDSAIVIKL